MRRLICFLIGHHIRYVELWSSNFGIRNVECDRCRQKFWHNGMRLVGEE